MTYILSGAKEITYDHLKTIETPKPEGRWHPLPHKTVAFNFLGHIRDRGWQIEETRYGIDKYNDMFGYIRLGNEALIGPNSATHLKQVIGIRNSHNKRFSVSAVSGSQVLVCSNLQFRGEFRMRRKHTTNIMRDLGSRINGLLDEVENNWERTLAAYAMYENTPLQRSQEHDLIMRATAHGAINPSDVLRVRDEYNNPRHEEFKEANAWSLFNAATEVLKRVPTQLAQKSIKLHEIFDDYCCTN